MRDIFFRAIFRGKDMATKKWVHGYYLKMVRTYIFSIDKKEEIIRVFVDRNTIGQYTGLKDRDGYEVYEGDIVQDPDDGALAEVVWDEDQAGFLISFLNCSVTAENMYCYSVVGNIIDNPEMVKELRGE